MGLEIRKNRFTKWYENEYFRILCNKLIPVFDELKLNGVLIGSGVCESNPGLQPDMLLVCETAVILIDLKKYGGVITLPPSGETNSSKKKDSWYQGKWFLNDEKRQWVKGGARNNPFQQLEAQTKKLNSLVENNIVPHLNENENCELKHTQRVVCFQLDVDFKGEVDSRHSHSFHIADPRTIVDTIKDIIDISPHEWEGSVTGYKLGINAFDLYKKDFRADTYDPSADNKLFSKTEFDEIEFPEINLEDIDELVAQEYEHVYPKIKPFLDGDKNVLLLNSDVTSFQVDISTKILRDLLKKEGQDEDELEAALDSMTCLLAPSNKNVNDLIRDGAPYRMRSLYGKLYDFENSHIELLSNSINEREEFPLQENKDLDGTIYVLYCGHLVYDFGEGDPEALLKFGSGSLCNDTIKYLKLDSSKNKLIIINDPYFYGFRADTIATQSTLDEKGVEYLKVDLLSRPTSPNQSNIAHLKDNIDNQSLNSFTFNGNDNISFYDEGKFIEHLNRLVREDGVNGVHILTRKKEDSKKTNKWIRKQKGLISPQIQKGDMILIKQGRVLVPEDRDPFAIPKYVQNGDLLEVQDILDRYSFSSENYNYPVKLEMSKCVVYLKEYDVKRTLYLSDFSLGDNENGADLKKHRQIRLQEIVQEYLSKQEISTKDVFLDIKEYEKYESVRAAVLSEKELFQEEDNAAAQEALNERLKKLDSKWKINKRKSDYVKAELLEDHTSEYFIISQMANYERGWALNLKSSYGYRFNHILLPKYTNAINNLDRFHSYLYSALSVSSRLDLQTFKSINPWFELPLSINIYAIGEKPEVNFLTQLEERELNETEQIIHEKFELKELDSRLTILASWINDKLTDEVEIDKIAHHNYQEEYHFRGLNETCRFQIFYKGNWNVTEPRLIGNENDLSKLIIQTLMGDESDKEAYPFIGELPWNLVQYKKLSEHLASDDLFISTIDSHQYRDRLSIYGSIGNCELDINYNGNNFFSSIDFRSKSSNEIVEIVLQKISLLKDE
jgi:hypothetical protein